MQRLLGQEPGFYFSADSGAGSGGSNAGDGAGTPPADTKPGEASAAGASAQGGQGPAGAGTGEGKPADGDGETKFDAAYVKTLRDEAAASRKALRAVQDELKKFKDAQLSEEQRREQLFKETQEERDALLAKVQRSERLAAAARAGARHPEDVADLIRPDQEDLTAAVEAIRKRYPAMFGPAHGSADGGAGTGNASAGSPPPAPPSDNMNARLRAAFGHGPRT